LERAVHGTQHVVLVEAEEAVDVQDLRNRRLAHADGADLGRFHQQDLELRAQCAGEKGGGQPAGGATAHDHQPSYACVVHVVTLADTVAVHGTPLHVSATSKKSPRWFARSGARGVRKNFGAAAYGTCTRRRSSRCGRSVPRSVPGGGRCSGTW